MGEWHNTTLGEVIAAGGGRIQTGPFGNQLHASDYVDAGIPCIMPVNMKANRVDLNGIALISEKDAARLSRHLVQEGDIVYSRRGDVTQKALIRKQEVGYFCGTGCLLVRPGHAIDAEFLTYYMSTQSIKDWLVSQSVGATMPNLNTGILAKVPLRIPDKTLQKRIASVLSALDDKIALNTRINAELEAMAKLLYDYWFVQFDFPNGKGKPYKSSGGAMVHNAELKREVPEGWAVVNLLEEMDVQYGFPFDTNQFTEDTKAKPVVRIRDILGCSFSAYSTQEVHEKYALQSGDLLIGMDGNFHMNYWDRDAGYLNQRSVRIRSINGSSVSNVQCFYDIQPHIKAREASVSRTTVGHLSDKDLKRMYVLVPVETKAFQPKQTFDGLLALMLSNRVQNQELTTLRDWLLPMLMNGQVLVGAAGIEVPLSIAAEPQAPYGLKVVHRKFGWIDQVTFNAWMVHKANKDRHFGRTKAEKVEHMIECVVGHDHERFAVRDAAGPVDWDRRTQLEDDLVERGWMRVEKIPLPKGKTMNRYHAVPRTTEVIKHVEELLGDSLPQVEHIIQIMRPLNTQQCEVRATLYSAWNDLLRAKKPHTDEDIIHDVLHNWHIRKNEVPDKEWPAGLKWLRSNGLVPTGNAKPVKVKKGRK